MKTILIMLALLVPVMAFAGDVPLRWDPVVGAAGYKIYQSLDGGVTWSVGADVGNVTSTTVLSVSDTVLVMFKVSAYPTGGAESIRHWSGAWYDGRKKPILTPGGAGIQ
jgi:hypothetical protein